MLSTAGAVWGLLQSAGPLGLHQKENAHFYEYNSAVYGPNPQKPDTNSPNKTNKVQIAVLCKHSVGTWS